MAVRDDTVKMNVTSKRRPWPRTTPPGAVAWLLVLTGVFVLAGCDDQLRRDQEAAVMALDRGEDRLALEDARRLARRGSSLQRAEAGYIGGVAAYRLGEYSEALRLLEPATRSSNVELRGMALIQQGTVQRAMGRTRQAATSLESGGLAVGGALGAKSLVRAGDAFKEVRLEADARRCREAAGRLDRRANIDPTVAGYTLQFGAYKGRDNAEARALEIVGSLRRAGISAPVLTRQDGLYKVQAGSYRDKATAGRALGRLRLPPGGGARITELGG